MSVEPIESRRATNRLAVALVALAVGLHGYRFTHSLGEFIDASHHLMNGIFIHDVLHQPITALSDPRAFAFNYYRHYPAVNLGYYPPVFPLTEAAMMLLFGVSGATGQLTVLLHTIPLTLFAFAWFRLRLSLWWAAGATVLLVAAPFLVYWGRDIMLETPVLAWVMGAVLFFERALRSDRPAWSACLGWATMSILAMWTKQQALMLPILFAVAVLAAGRWRHLLQLPVLCCGFLVALGAAGLLGLMYAQGGDVVGHSLGFTAQHVADRFNARQWLFYFKKLPLVCGWPLLAFAALGVVTVLMRRIRGLSPVVAWLVVFYVVHSYPRAQDSRYAILWLPPICLLATLGAQGAGAALAAVRRAGNQVTSRPGAAGSTGLAALLAALLVGESLVRSLWVRVPPVPPAYTRATDDLAELLGDFSCLSFVPSVAARPAVLFRLAVEERRSSAHDIYAFGRMLRAHHVLRDWRSNWGDVRTLAGKLEEWNIKYILLERPTVLNPGFGDEEIDEALELVLALGEFRLRSEYAVDLSLPRYPAPMKPGEYPQRKLLLYERIAPMTYNPGAHPALQPHRVPMTIPGT
ncbi:MAG: glycosyltransferase family 39 protein [Planctomycetes bacterium]|nr:glycosyltransferase family 39 protein [Planctomycetota bacterium]